MIFRSVVYFIGLVWVVCACRPSSYTEEELYEYIKDPDNHLLVEQKLSDVKMSCYYKPSSLVAQTEIQNNKGADSIIKHYNQYLYFIVSLSVKDQNLEQYYATNQYSTFGNKISDMSFHMKDYFHITTEGGVKVNPLEVVSPRVFGSANASSFMLIFDRSELKDSKGFKVNYADNELGSFSFPFSVADIDKASTIKIK